MNIATAIDHKLLSRKWYLGVQCSIIVSIFLLYLLSFFVTFNGNLQTRKDASGFEPHYASRFFYFYYYTGYFPLATLDTNLTYSKTAALNEINQDGKDLIMEYKHWARLGEHARIFCYLPGAWLKGTAAAPSLRLFNALFFLMGLLFLYRGFYNIRRPLIGLLMCIAILLTPYFHYEVFRNENIFALQASVFFSMLGLLLPFLFTTVKLNLKSLMLLFTACLLIAFCSEIRNEISVVFVSVLLIVALSSFISIQNKAVLIALAFIFFMGTKKVLQFHFENKFETAKQLVAAKGGHIYTGKKIAGHKIWHPVFCGLGDYDRKYGYVWNDTVAYEYATPLLNARYHLNLKYSGKLFTDNFYDAEQLYYIKFDEIPEYEAIVKEKVIHDIKCDPLWYLKILAQRLLKICTTTLPFPFLGFIALGGLLFFIYKRRSNYIKLLLTALPLSATSLLIYSGMGATYNSMFGFIIIALLVYDVLQTGLKKETAIN